MRKAAILYRNGQLEACERDDVWTVRLANLEVRASYLDLALAELLGNASEAHRAAVKLLPELEEVAEWRGYAHSPVAAMPARERSRRRRTDLWSKPLVLGLRVLVLAAVTATAFLLTTWLSVLR
jgi:hypothetical protein